MQYKKNRGLSPENMKWNYRNMSHMKNERRRGVEEDEVNNLNKPHGLPLSYLLFLFSSPKEIQIKINSVCFKNPCNFDNIELSIYIFKVSILEF